MGKRRKGEGLTAAKCESILKLISSVGSAEAAVLTGYAQSTCNAVALADRKAAEGDIHGVKKVSNRVIENWALQKYGLLEQEQTKLSDKTDAIINLLDSIDKSLAEIRKAVKGGLMDD